MTNDEMLDNAKSYAAITINLAAKDIKNKTGGGHGIPFCWPSDMYIVWFSKTLQNWKALVSTDKIKSDDPIGSYVEVTYNGYKNEAYCDLYKKQRNICYPTNGESVTHEF